ncbi:MAG: hypothetical protein EBS10_00700 [Acidimicrobiia bacterium]|nr:hypothetical protein [Acidimicrobiia bacterium]
MGVRARMRPIPLHPVGQEGQVLVADHSAEHRRAVALELVQRRRIHRQRRHGADRTGPRRPS